MSFMRPPKSWAKSSTCDLHSRPTNRSSRRSSLRRKISHGGHEGCYTFCWLCPKKGIVGGVSDADFAIHSQYVLRLHSVIGVWRPLPQIFRQSTFCCKRSNL